MPVFKPYQRSRKFGNQQPEDIKPYDDANPSYSKEDTKKFTEERIGGIHGESIIGEGADVFSDPNPRSMFLKVQAGETLSQFDIKPHVGQPFTPEISKKLTAELDDRIKLAESVLGGNLDTGSIDPGAGSRIQNRGNKSNQFELSISQRKRWQGELSAAKIQRTQLVTEINKASGWHGYSDEIIDVQTEKTLRHHAFTTGQISDLNTTRADDLIKLTELKVSGEYLTPSEKKASKSLPSYGTTNKYGTQDVPQQSLDTVRNRFEFIEEGGEPSLKRDMFNEQKAVGNFDIISLEDRADISGGMEVREGAPKADPYPEKQPDLGQKLTELGSDDVRLHSTMQGLVEGPYGVSQRTIGGAVFGTNKGYMEKPAYNMESYKKVVVPLLREKGLTMDINQYIEAVTTTWKPESQFSQLENTLAGVHKEAEVRATMHKAISDDIKSSSVGEMEVQTKNIQSGKGGRINLDAPGKVTKTTIQAYFSGKYGDVKYADMAGAHIMGKDALAVAGKANLPEIKSPGNYDFIGKSMYDRYVTGGALSGTGEFTPEGKGFKGESSYEYDQNLRKSVGVGGNVEVVPNTESSYVTGVGDDAEVVPHRQTPTESIDEVMSRHTLPSKFPIEDLRRGIVPGIIALKGIVNPFKGGGGGGKFSK